MIKLRNLGWVSVAALLVGFGTAASAAPATFTQSSNSTEDNTETSDVDETMSSAPVVAAELFGSGTAVKLEFGTGFQPVYKLIYNAATGDDVNFGGNDQGLITYTLSGATFAERVSPSDFAFGDASSATLERTAGGAKGDASVTIRVNAGGMWESGDTLTFTIPWLNATGRSAKAPVRMSAALSIDRTSKFPEGGPVNSKCGETSPVPVGCKLVTVTPKIATFALSGGSGGMIDLSNRAMLIGASGKNMADIALGTVTVAANASTAIKGQDGMAASLSGDLAGDVAISVSSDHFRTGDIVYIDDNKSGTQDDSRELFTIADGVATGDRPLKDGMYTVRYKPNGTDPLVHDSSLTLSARTDFTDRENMNRSATPAGVKSTLKLAGIKGNPPKAYAIAPVDNMDVSNVRITCEAGKACMAFLSCRDSDGMSTFGDAGVSIPAYGTVRLDQAQVAAALGMMPGEEWSGRLACTVLSTAKISVQVLTRAAGVLVNNTYVTEGGDTP